MSGHLRLGSRDETSFAIRYMEEVPLQTMGNLSFELALHPVPAFEFAPSLGLAGPFDGAMLGVRGRVWFTPEAAVHLRACIGGQDQYGIAGGLSARWPAKRGPQ